MKTQPSFSQLKRTNEYLVIDWGGHDHWLGSNIMQQTGTCGPWFPVPELHHCQCTWMTPAELQVDCSTGPKPPRNKRMEALSLEAGGAISATDLNVDIE